MNSLRPPPTHGQPPLDRDAMNERMVSAVVSSSIQPYLRGLFKSRTERNTKNAS